MSSIIESPVIAKSRVNDLNSVLIEGEVVGRYPPLEENPHLITHVEVRTIRYNYSDGRKNLTSFIRVGLEVIEPLRRCDLLEGKKVRVVGRLYAPHRKPPTIIADYIEIKPHTKETFSV